MIRVRRCLVRAIVRQPWQFEDADVLSTALTRLVADVLAPRLADQLNRVGQGAPLATVTLHVTLPAQAVLGLATETPVSSDGRHLASFGAELAVHAATSHAVRVAVERQGAEPGDPARTPEAGAIAPPGGREAGILTASAGDRLALAVRGTLLASWRLGRLRQLLGRCEPALLAEWARLVSRQRPQGSAVPADAEGASAGAADAAFEAFLDVFAATAGAGPGFLRKAESTDAPSAGVADAAFEAFLDILAATAGPWPGDAAGALKVGAMAAPEGQEARVPAASAGDRLGLAVRGTLLAAWRLGRLRQLLGRCEPALLAQWARVVSGQHSQESTVPTVVEASTAGAADARSAGVADAAFEAFIDVLGATAGAGPDAAPGLLREAGAADGRHAGAADGPPAEAADGPPVGVADARSAGAADARSAGVADAAFEAFIDVLAATGGAGPGLVRESEAVASGHGRLESAMNLEFELASVLPFLLVAPLDDLGVLDAVTAALASPDCTELLAAFAACLARKTLPPPAAGWLQPPEVTATVAAFVGQAHPPDGSACERLARTVTGWWPVVHEALAAQLVGLRAEGAPLVATPSPGGLVLADADGLVPLLWDADADAARQLWEDCGRPPVLVHPALAPAGLRGLRPVPDRVHTRPLSELVALAGRRPASGRAGFAPELEAPAGLLAGVGLAVLAWELWHRHGERIHPALAIERLGDLDGRVRLGPDSVTVQMPIGRRHADLRDSGLLRTVDDVPWLQGRRLELLGG